MNPSDMHTTNAAPYHNMETVLRGDAFFWVGRGGHGVTKKGNADVRSIVESKAAEYIERERNNRGVGFAKELLHNELRGIKFVAPLKKVLSDLEKDEREERANGAVERRRLSARRRDSLLEKHGGLEKIRSYPEGVCIEVGDGWVLDILQHKLREYAKTLRATEQTVPATAAVDDLTPLATSEEDDDGILGIVMAGLEHPEQDETLGDFYSQFLSSASPANSNTHTEWGDGIFEMDFDLDVDHAESSFP